MSAITAKARRKMKKYAVLTREPRCFLGSFDFSWEQRKLGDVATFINGRAYSQPELLSSGKYKVLRVGNFYTNDSWYYSDLELGEKYYADYGDLLYTWSATFGPHIWLGDRVIYHYHIWKIDLSNQLEKQFAVQLLEQDKANILSSKNGSTMVHITKEGMEQKDVIIPPSTKEQQEIGAFFQQLDNLITLHQRKCALLFSSFQALISMMFTTSTFSWEQRKFSDITFPAGEKNKDNLPLESYSITNEYGFVPQDEKFENGGTMREADKRMYYIVSPNSFAYNPARINVGSIGYQNVGENVIVSSLYEVFKTSEDVDDRLLWHWFKSPDFQKLIMQLQEGGVRLYFYYDKLCMGEVFLPSLEEQRKIGKLFDTIDHLITLHQRKLEEEKRKKKALMQLLLTGLVRVNA